MRGSVRETLIIDSLQAVRNDVARPLAVTERGRTAGKDYDRANLTGSPRPDPGTVGPKVTRRQQADDRGPLGLNS